MDIKTWIIKTIFMRKNMTICAIGGKLQANPLLARKNKSTFHFRSVIRTADFHLQQRSFILEHHEIAHINSTDNITSTKTISLSARSLQ